jgi:hypothetical protein
MSDQMTGASEQVDVDLAVQSYGKYVGVKSGVFRKTDGAPVPIKYDLFPSILAYSELDKYRAIIAKTATSARAIDRVFEEPDGAGPLEAGWFFYIQGEQGTFRLHAGQFAIDLFDSPNNAIFQLEKNLSSANGIGAL